jgi:hypothetical protein
VVRTVRVCDISELSLVPSISVYNLIIMKLATVARHIFQACPVWIYTQSNITQASYSPEYITPTQQILYFLLHIFNTRASFLSSFLNFVSKFAQFLYMYFKTWNLIQNLSSILGILWSWTTGILIF